jgi:hypothetical protein
LIDTCRIAGDSSLSEVEPLLFVACRSPHQFDNGTAQLKN